MVHDIPANSLGSQEKSGISSALAEFEKAQKNQQYDLYELDQSLKTAVELWKKKGNVQQAFMMMTMLVLPEAMQCKGDKLSLSSAKMNIGSECSKMITEMTNDLTTMSSGTGHPGDDEKVNAAAANLQKVTASLKSILSSPSSKEWIDGSTSSQVLQALNSFAGVLGLSIQPPSTIAAEVEQWTAGPGTKFGDKTGQQLIQGLNGSLNQANNAFNGYSQMQNNATQFESNVVGQLLNATKGIFQSLVNFGRAAVNNQRAAG